jgi:hypothetical protein
MESLGEDSEEEEEVVAATEDGILVLQGCDTCGLIHDPDTEPHCFLYLEDATYEELRDPISLEPFWDPVTLSSSCKHIFTRDSIEAAIKLRGCCPIDKSPQALSDIESAPFVVKNLVNKLQVYCPYHCTNLTMERELLSTHLQTCPLAKVVCQRTANGKACGAVFNRADSLTHEIECPCRLIQCDKGCNALINFTELNEHDCTTLLLKRNAMLEGDSYALKRIKVSCFLLKSVCVCVLCVCRRTQINL